MTDALTKLLALYIGFKYGVIALLSGAGDAGALGVLWHWAFALFMIMVAVGFWKYQGWAFLVVSVGLIASWLLALIDIILAADKLANVPGAAADGVSVWPGIISFILVMVTIGVFGRWDMERKFRPHLDVDH